MITTADPVVARTLRLLRNQGMEQRYANEIVGANLRLTDVAAAIGRQQLRRLRSWTERRRAHAATLTEALQGVVVPSVPDGFSHVYHQYTVRASAPRRPGRAPVSSGSRHRHLLPDADPPPAPLPHREAHPDPRWDLPETDRAATEVLSLPVHPGLSAEALQRVIEAVNDWGNPP